ncbi:helix-turn-helix domain-containing protein [Halobacteriaceae archaeon GCM10025711]
MERPATSADGEVTVTFTAGDGAGIWRLSELPVDVTVELEPTVTLDSTPRRLVTAWTDADGFSPFERLLDGVNGADWTVLGRYRSHRTYRVEATDDTPVFDLLAANDASLRSATGTPDGWSFEARFPDHSLLTAFYRDCLDAGIDVDVTGLDADPGRRGTQHDLSATERESLRYAYERGYFDVPRDVTLVALAEELGVSDQTLSERIRRGSAVLIEHALR